MTAPYPPFSLQVSDLAVTRGGRTVLGDIAFGLKSGEAILLTGPNGVGKSTLLRALLGLVHRDRGEIRLSGAGPDEEPGAHCHYVGHRDAIKTALSVTENIRFWQDFLGVASVPALEALEALDLADLADLPAACLSAGQRRRLGLARLIAVDRPIWLLDEPTSALDTASEARLAGLMRAHIARNGAILAATHLAIDLPDARRLALCAAEAA